MPLLVHMMVDHIHFLVDCHLKAVRRVQYFEEQLICGDLCILSVDFGIDRKTKNSELIVEVDVAEKRSLIYHCLLF